MLRILVLMASALLAPSIFAQDAVQTDGDKYKVVLENDCVRVLDYRDRPGEKTHQHKHPAFVLYALSPFKRTLTSPDGKVSESRPKTKRVATEYSTRRPGHFSLCATGQGPI